MKYITHARGSWDGCEAFITIEGNEAFLTYKDGRKEKYIVRPIASVLSSVADGAWKFISEKEAQALVKVSALYATREGGFGCGTAYVYVKDNKGFLVSKDGVETPYDKAYIRQCVTNGNWKAITKAQAEALVKKEVRYAMYRTGYSGTEAYFKLENGRSILVHKDGRERDCYSIETIERWVADGSYKLITKAEAEGFLNKSKYTWEELNNSAEAGTYVQMGRKNIHYVFVVVVQKDTRAVFYVEPNTKLVEVAQKDTWNRYEFVKHHENIVNN